MLEQWDTLWKGLYLNPSLSILTYLTKWNDGEATDAQLQVEPFPKGYHLSNIYVDTHLLFDTAHNVDPLLKLELTTVVTVLKVLV